MNRDISSCAERQGIKIRSSGRGDSDVAAGRGQADIALHFDAFANPVCECKTAGTQNGVTKDQYTSNIVGHGPAAVEIQGLRVAAA